MLRPRIIPCLLVRDKGLVKTVGFGKTTYVGDPINAVKIFNEKEADELIILDIDATARGTGPDYRMIERIAAESRMPLCYGGGVSSAEQAKRIVGLGVEKVAMSSAIAERSDLVREVAEEVGRQSVVAVMDVKKALIGQRYGVWIRNASRNIHRSPAEFAAELEQLGAGEILVNSVDRDGQMKGYDLALIDQVRAATTLPMTALGGAGSLQDLKGLIDRFGIIGAAAGSLFVFKGVYKAVLINYPTRTEKEGLFGGLPQAASPSSARS